MTEYVWKARTTAGNILSGEMEEVNEAVVMTKLRRMNYADIKIKKKPKDLFENIQWLQPRVKTKDVVIFTRQFATMIDAGLPLVQCLEILASQQENKTFKKVLLSIKGQVEGGSTFAEALKQHPKVFDELFVNLVHAGETGGILDTILRRLAAFMEKAEQLKRKVKGAMVYPAVVLAIAVGVVALLLVFVIPVFGSMFEGQGASLPGPTVFVMNMSDFMRSYIIHIIVVIGLLVFAFRKFYQTPRGRLIVDRIFLKLPAFGLLLKKVAVSRFCATLGTMISSGVPILDALEITAKTAGNVIIENAIMATRTAIAEGRTIAEPLMETGIFPGMVVRMIAVGEATGALDAMLAKIAEFYDEEVDAAVEALTQLMEPIMIVFLGGTCGGMVIAMYLPVFSMAGVMAGGQ
ncbi:MAG: type II secretion system F family protein [Deltaproteobacteria bacterium]|nr:type II secretion system F family protein [Deltaproteobacteria bacterium]